MKCIHFYIQILKKICSTLKQRIVLLGLFRSDESSYSYPYLLTVFSIAAIFRSLLRSLTRSTCTYSFRQSLLWVSKRSSINLFYFVPFLGGVACWYCKMCIYIYIIYLFIYFSALWATQVFCWTLSHKCHRMFMLTVSPWGMNSWFTTLWLSKMTSRLLVFLSPGSQTGLFLWNLQKSALMRRHKNRIECLLSV